MKSIRMTMVSLATIGALFSPLSLRAAEDEPADAVRMSLSECLARALEQNLDLVIARKDPEIARFNIKFQQAPFDVVVDATLRHAASSREQTSTINDGVNPPVSTSESSRAVNDHIDGSLSQRLSFGATYTVSAFGDTSPPTSGEFFDPILLRRYTLESDRPKDWSYSLGFKLPLLKGLGRTVNEASLLVAKHNLNISERELQRRAELTIKAVEDAYWDLLATLEAQKVAGQALKLSQQLYELNKKKVEVGTLAPIEITQAEANVASNVEGTIRAKQAVRNAEDNLRRLLAVPENDPLWAEPIIPTEKPMSDPVTIDQAAAIKVASERRAEVTNAREQIEISKVNEAASHNEVKHKLDLSADWSRYRAEAGQTYTYTNPPQLPYSVESVGRISPNWLVELIYSYPFGNRSAKASYAVAKLNREKSEISLESVLQDVRVDVRAATRAVETGYERVVAGRKNVELQQKKLDAEQKKFDNGMSTSFEVFTFQTDLRNSQLSLIQALLDYNKSLVDLERAKGTLLESKGLQLAADAGR